MRGRLWVTFAREGKGEAETKAEENVNGDAVGRQWTSMATASDVNGDGNGVNGDINAQSMDVSGTLTSIDVH